ncbi:MAG: alpha/beta hydrolase [FCB group bacterium]|nr:alpha/beta hydrolase [FCB group bacterium]
MPYLELQGTRLFYEYCGKGRPPLVFVHAYAGSHDDWQPQVEFFRTQHDVITCDLRGHGASGGDPEHCTIETFGADINALLSALDLPPAILIGHSLGCRVVLQAYREAPHRTAGLILVDGSRLATGDPQVAEQTARQLLQSVGYTALLHRLFTDMFPEGSSPALKDRILRRALALPEDIGTNLLIKLFDWDARHLDAALSRIAVPLLVIQSTYINTRRLRVSMQPGTTTPWFDLIRKHVPAAQIEIVSGVGHFAMLEAPEIMNQIIAAFIAGIPADGRKYAG